MKIQPAAVQNNEGDDFGEFLLLRGCGAAPFKARGWHISEFLMS